MHVDGWLDQTSVALPGHGILLKGESGCSRMLRSLDGRAEIVEFLSGGKVIHFPADQAPHPVYPLTENPIPTRPRAVLMDLDGTTALTEHLWNDMIQNVARELLPSPNFMLTSDDIPNVSGFSVEENLRYVLKRYGAGDTESGVQRGLVLQSEMMNTLLDRMNAGDPAAIRMVEPAPQLKELLLWLRRYDIRIGLVSAAPEKKVLAEISCVFKQLGLGNPVEFYDVIITSGSPPRGKMDVKRAGTMGDACSKPHPWPYIEALHQLGVGPEETIGIEDSSAGILSLVTAGIPAVGVGFDFPRPGTAETLCAKSFADLTGVARYLMGC